MAEPSDALVIYGITGDLAYKKIFPACRRSCVADGSRCRSSASRDRGQRQELVERARASLEADGSFDPASFEKLAGLLRLVAGDYNDAGHIREDCGRRSATRSGPLHYLAIPPTHFPVVIKHLAEIRVLHHAARASSSRSRSAVTCNRRAI